MESASGTSKSVIGIVIVALIMIGVNGYVMNTYTTSGQNAESLASATKTFMIANLILTLLLGFFAYVQGNQNPGFMRTYMIIIIHVALLISITAMSVALITKA
jgi:cytochrome bd-type quinol oxidase subunit 2